MPKRYTKDTSQMLFPSEMSQKSTEQSSDKSTSLPLDFHAKIYQSLENEKGWKVLEVASSFRRQGLFVSANLVYSSLKMSKGCFPPMAEGTLNESCEKLPTLGFMSANGNLLIQVGYYPKIESGFTLSDILEKEVDEKYFLSEKAMLGIMKSNYQERKPMQGGVAKCLKIGGDVPCLKVERE